MGQPSSVSCAVIWDLPASPAVVWVSLAVEAAPPSPGAVIYYGASGCVTR